MTLTSPADQIPRKVTLLRVLEDGILVFSALTLAHHLNCDGNRRYTRDLLIFDVVLKPEISIITLDIFPYYNIMNLDLNHCKWYGMKFHYRALVDDEKSE